MINVNTEFNAPLHIIDPISFRISQKRGLMDYSEDHFPAAERVGRLQWQSTPIFSDS